MSNDEKTRFRLDPSAETLAIKRLKLAVLMQMTFVGVPCVYYGDEIGMQGLRDPFNRKPYTWRCIDPDLLGFYKKAIALRNSTDCLKTGDFNILYADNDVLVYKRQINKAKDVFGKPSQNGAAVCCINRSGETRRISFGIEQETTQNLTGVLSGAVIRKKSKTIEIELKGFEGEVYIG
jgi:4-alpha-glucanotransferase